MHIIVRSTSVLENGGLVHHHHLLEVGLAGLCCLALGLLILLGSSATRAVRQRQQAEEQAGSTRVQERIAGPELKAGAVLTVLGAADLLIWWLVLR